VNRLKQQVRFLIEADRLKTVLRQNFLADRSRQENSAEHSWHLSLMAQVLSEHFPKELDLARVTRMLIIHDLVEVIAGDTFCYDEAAAASKAGKEQQAAAQLFGMLPADQSEVFIKTWEEFEEGKTVESRAAWAIDRLQPFLLNYYTDGGSWKVHGVRRAQVEKRMEPTRAFSPALRDLVNQILDEAVAKSWIKA